jgi:hypothetical protein
MFEMLLMLIHPIPAMHFTVDYTVDDESYQYTLDGILSLFVVLRYVYRYTIH